MGKGLDGSVLILSLPCTLPWSRRSGTECFRTSKPVWPVPKERLPNCIKDPLLVSESHKEIFILVATYLSNLSCHKSYVYGPAGSKVTLTLGACQEMCARAVGLLRRIWANIYKQSTNNKVPNCYFTPFHLLFSWRLQLLSHPRILEG